MYPMRGAWGCFTIQIQYINRLTYFIVREYNLYQWEARLKVIAEIVGKAQVF
jgi:hypothetical protein